MGTRGSPGAALRREREPEPRGHMVAPELGAGARAAGTRGNLEATLNREAGAVVLTWSLYARVPGPQGTDSGSRAHLGRGCEPRVGPTSFPRAIFLSLYVLGFRSGGASRLICGDPRFTWTLRCSRNRHAPQFLVGRYCSAEIVGPEVIMTTIPEPAGLHAYGMHRDSVLAPLLHLLVVQRRLMSGA
jgi:hypothetical protein